MSTMTNKTSLPQFIIEVANRLYNSHRPQEELEFSTTELLKGTKELLLLRRHSNEIEQDVQDSASLWTGTAMHSYIQGVAEEFGLICEKELSTEYIINGAICKVSGRFDFYDPFNSILYDLKDCKVATFQKAQKGEDKKWLKQLGAYALRLKTDCGADVKKICIIAIITDHSKIKAQTDPSYPQGAIQMLTWDIADLGEDFFKEIADEQIAKLEEILKYNKKADDSIPPCSAEERFEDEHWGVYLKKKDGTLKSRSEKNFDDEKTALNYAELIGGEVVHKEGKPIKCELYCSCNKFCNFYQNYLKNKETNNGEL